MESNKNSNNLFSPLFYEEVLRSNKGILSINSKMPVKDRSALAQVYTPGVGSCCKLIEKDIKRAYDLTNKKNAILVVSDASGLNIGTKSSNFANAPYNQNVVLPYLEAVSIYYKLTSNIDAYSILIDSSKLSSHSDIQETVKAIMPAFSGVEFFAVNPHRIKDFSSEGAFSFVDGSKKRELDQFMLKSNKNLFEKGVCSHLIYSGVMRAALELQCYHNLEECVDFVVKILTKLDHEKYNVTDALNILLEITTLASKFLIEKNKISTISPKEVNTKLLSFLVRGKSAWVEEYPTEFYAKKRY